MEEVKDLLPSRSQSEIWPVDEPFEPRGITQEEADAAMELCCKY